MLVLSMMPVHPFVATSFAEEEPDTSFAEEEPDDIQILGSDYAVAGGNIKFDASTGMVTRADKDITEAVIPEKIDGVEVKGIGTWAFYECHDLKKIVLPDTVKTIAKGAFYGSDAFTEIDIPEGVETIGEMAFYECRGLKKISLPSTLRKIDRLAFYRSGLQYADIPGNVTFVGNLAFAECASLEGVFFVKDSAPDAGTMVFDSCYKLEYAVNSPIMSWNLFKDSCKRALIYLDTDDMRERQTRMWRIDRDGDDEDGTVEEKKAAIKKTAEEITKDCRTDLERAMAISLWLDERMEYERGNDNSAWEVYKGIMEKEGTGKKQKNSCGGYSNITQVLMQSLGIPCATVYREAKNGESIDHEYNAAYFDGKWRWLDNTASNGVWVNAGTAGFAADSDHRVDDLLYLDPDDDTDHDIYKEIPLDIEIDEDEKTWPNQNKSDKAYEKGKGYSDPEFEHEIDPEEEAAEKEKVAEKAAELEAVFSGVEETDQSLFTIDENGVITGVKDGIRNLDKVKIPDKINGVTVKAIGGDDRSAFSGLYNLEYLWMPDTITEICENGFSNCTNLKGIHLSSGLKEIKQYTFTGCKSLESLTIPSSVKRLAGWIFRGCDSLIEVLFEDFSFKERARATDPMGSTASYEAGTADISWYAFTDVGRALYGLDFDKSYIGTKYHRALQKVERGNDWRENIRRVLYSQMGYREGFSPYHIDGSNTKPFRTPARAAYWEWGHFAEAGRFDGINGTTWCHAFIEWDYAMAGISPDYETSEDYKWSDTSYAGGEKNIKIETGDMIGVGKTHWAMAEKAEVEGDCVKLYIMQGNAGDRMVCTEIVYYDKKTGKPVPVNEETGKPYPFVPHGDRIRIIVDDQGTQEDVSEYADRNELRFIKKPDFSGMGTHYITFDKGDGTCEVSKRIFGNGAYYGALPEAYKDDYVFEGWFTEKTGGTKALPYMNTGDADETLYAHYRHDPTAVKGVSVDKESVTLKEGETLQITASVTPDNAKNKAVTYRSGNDEVVTVTKDGLLTGVKEGNATILIRAEGGPYTAYCEATVTDSSGGGSGGGGSGGGGSGTPEYVKYDVAGGKIIFDKNSGTVTGYEGAVTEAVIPVSIDGIPVKMIGKEAFYKCGSLVKVLLPEGLEVIGQSAFEATSLTGVSIPDSVKRIEKWAFCDTQTLEYAIIGKGVEYISTWSFTSNPKFTTAYFRGNKDSIEIGEQAFPGRTAFKDYNPETDPAFETVKQGSEGGSGESENGESENGDSGEGGSGEGGSGKGGSGGVSGNGSSGSGGVSDNKVKPLDGGEFASANDNFAPIATEGKINKLKLDFVNVLGSGVDPLKLRMTVVKGSKLKTVAKVMDKGSAQSDGGIKVKVNKSLIATITCKSDGDATLTMEDGVTYKITFKVEKPKAVKSAQAVPLDPAGKAVKKTLLEMFNTEIDSGTLTVQSAKGQASVSGNAVIVKPVEKRRSKCCSSTLTRSTRPR